jgi:hypothetical protein
VADENAVAAIDAPLAPGTTHVVWQLAADELHDIMQLVTVEVTFDVSGGTGVEASCAEAATKTIDASAVDRANTIATRRIIASTMICSRADKTRTAQVRLSAFGNRPPARFAAPAHAVRKFTPSGCSRASPRNRIPSDASDA